MIILELFEPITHEWKIRSDDLWIGNFVVDGYNYEVRFECHDDMGNNWLGSFARLDQYGKPIIDVSTGGNPYKVFSAVLEMVKEFFSIIYPLEVAFTADSESRRRLYHRLFVRLSLSDYKWESRDDFFVVGRRR